MPSSDGANVKRLAGRYGDALQRLARAGGPTPEWFAATRPLQRKRILAELRGAGLGSLIDEVACAEHELCGLLATARGTVPASDLTALERYVRWSLLPARRKRHPSDRGSLEWLRPMRMTVLRSLAFLQHLHVSGRTLATATLEDLHSWSHPTAKVEPFLRFAKRHRLATLTPSSRPFSPRNVATPAAQRRHIGLLLTDRSIRLDVRVAGLLVYFGFLLSEVVALRCEDIELAKTVVIRVGNGRYALRHDIGTLVRRLVHTRKEGWLFPGLGGDRHLSARTMLVHFRPIGIVARLARNSYMAHVAHNFAWLVSTAAALDRNMKHALRWRTARNARWSEYLAQRVESGSG